jgi:hypothetical protein
LKRIAVVLSVAVVLVLVFSPVVFAAKTTKKKTAPPPTPTLEEFNQLKEQVSTLSAQTESQQDQISGLKSELSQAVGQAQEAQEGKAATEERLAALQGTIDGLNEAFLTTKADVDKLAKLSVSGYIQARYEWQSRSQNGTNTNFDNYYIRRGRVKFTYTAGPTSKYVLYFDGSKQSVSMKEAYVVLTEPWSKHDMSLLIGQANYPFGFEIERSSSTREVPERSKAERTLFPGERDRGIIVTLPVVDRNGWKMVLDGSSLNGTGVDNSTFAWQDPTRRKDYTGRARFQLPTFGPMHVDFGVSTYFGDTYIPATSTVPGFVADKQRLGGDLQLYYTMPTPLFKSGALFFEVYKAKDYSSKYGLTRAEVNDTLKRGKDSDFGVVNELGFYGMWVTNITNSLQFAARYDYWNPVTDPDQATDADTLSITDKSRQKTYAAALNYFWDANVRLTAALEVPFFTHTESMTPPFSSDYNKDYDNKSHTVTVQVQYKF